MKKLFAAVIFSFCCLTLAAGNKEAMFNELVRATAAQLPDGASATRDAEYRIMFINYPLQIHSRDGFNCNAAKKAIVQAIRGSEDARYIRETEAIIVYNYISTDRKIFSIVITGADL